MNKRSIRKIYLPVFSMYSNLALDTIKVFIGGDNSRDDFKPYRAIRQLRDSICDRTNADKCKIPLDNIPVDKIDSIHDYLIQFKSYYPFMRAIKDPQDNETTTFLKLVEWLDLLNDIRNKYSHTKTKDLTYSEYIQREIQHLYNTAIENSALYKNNETGSSALFPQKYRNLFKNTPEGEVYLEYTGIIFFISLFLRSQHVSMFLSELQHAALLNKEGEIGRKSIIERRKEYLEEHPELKGEKYPESLQVKSKDFLYGNDVYTYWAIRGHIVLAHDKELDAKIRFFDLLNYLKQCPPERINLKFRPEISYKRQKISNIKVYQEQGNENIPLLLSIKGSRYLLREKNNFVNYALGFWDEVIAPCFNGDNAKSQQRKWEWAMHASGSQKQSRKEEKGFDKLMFHEKIVWEKPQSHLNGSDMEEGSSYYVENNNVFFKLQQGDVSIVGLMSTKVLYDLFRVIFSKCKDRYDVKSISHVLNEPFNMLWQYMKGYLECTTSFKEKNENLAIPVKLKDEDMLKDIIKNAYEDIPGYVGVENRNNGIAASNERWDLQQFMTKEFKWMLEKPLADDELQKRISSKVTLMKEKYLHLSMKATSHQKMNETVKAWFAILNYGAESNWAHAAYPQGGSETIIEQYRKITYYLSRLTNPEETFINAELLRYLHLCGLDKLLIERRKGLITQCSKLDDYFNKAMEYRMDVLKQIEEKLGQPFNRSQWNPTEELRWLKVKAPERARPYPKVSIVPTNKKTIENDHSIINLEKGVYYATRGVPIFHNFFSKTLGYDPSKLENGIGITDDFYCVDYKLVRGTDFRRLYTIKEQDNALSCIADFYANKFNMTGLDGLQDISSDFQSAQIDIKKEIKDERSALSEVSVRYYYRYYKQSRYQIAPLLYEGLLRTAVKFNLLSDAKYINFNNLRPQKDSEGKVSFVSDPDIPYPTVVDLLSAYNSSRYYFIGKLLKLDRKLCRKYEHELQGTFDENGYIPFRIYVDLPFTQEIKSKLKILNGIRRKAMHGYVADEAIETDESSDKVKILFFKKGVDLIEEISQIL